MKKIYFVSSVMALCLAASACKDPNYYPTPAENNADTFINDADENVQTTGPAHPQKDLNY